MQLVSIEYLPLCIESYEIENLEQNQSRSASADFGKPTQLFLLIKIEKFFLQSQIPLLYKKN